MVPFIVTAREHHRVRSAEEYVTRHAAFIARQATTGARYEVHESDVTLVAWVGANQWLVDCECGAGNATDPGWGIACCYGCGAVHRGIVFPADVAALEAALLKRVRPTDRHWLPGETVDDLIAENIAAGIEAA